MGQIASTSFTVNKGDANNNYKTQKKIRYAQQNTGHSWEITATGNLNTNETEGNERKVVPAVTSQNAHEKDQDTEPRQESHQEIKVRLQEGRAGFDGLGIFRVCVLSAGGRSSQFQSGKDRECRAQK